MLNDTDVHFITYADKHSYRKWKIKEVRYDFDYDGYYVHKLNKEESVTFATPYGAYNHAKHILRKYKKKYSDAIIVIEEVEFMRIDKK